MCVLYHKNIASKVKRHGKLKLNKNTLGVKKCEANQKQHCKQVRPKTLISVEAKKLLIKNLFNYLNDIQ